MAAVGFALALAALALGTVPMIGVVALIPASIGLVFSVIGLVQSRQTHQGKWIAIPGIVVSVAAAFWVPVASTLVPWFAKSVTHISVATTAPPTTTTAVSPPPARQRIIPPADSNQYSSPAMRRHPVGPVTPTRVATGARDAAEAQHTLERQIAEFAERARKEAVESWPGDVASFRKSIDALGDAGVTSRLHRTLDDAVMVLVESEAAAALQGATKASPAEGLRILDAFMQRAQAAQTVAYATPLTPSMQAAAELRNNLAMQEDPAQRYVPRGVMGGARGVRVTLHDALTGENHLVAEGVALADGCTVTSINEATREVTLTRRGKEYLLRW